MKLTIVKRHDCSLLRPTTVSNYYQFHLCCLHHYCVLTENERLQKSQISEVVVVAIPVVVLDRPTAVAVDLDSTCCYHSIVVDFAVVGSTVVEVAGRHIVIVLVDLVSNTMMVFVSVVVVEGSSRQVVELFLLDTLRHNCTPLMVWYTRHSFLAADMMVGSSNQFDEGSEDDTACQHSHQCHNNHKPVVAVVVGLAQAPP